ncbi:MAG: hypothetical protein R3314_11520 [Longimicrobiales bacterium]|nr:hypothetical protein [Longimicrobiales bacterium]
MRKLLILALAASGCVHMSRDVLVDRSSHPVPQEDVRVVFDDDDIPEGCERIAYLLASASTELADENDVMKKFRKEAGKLGANLVMVQQAYGSSRPSASVFDSGGDTEFDGEAYWCPDGEAGGSSTGR